ncbi:MAG: hypothetical protein U9O98_01275 [Asgard group archaeon]|nr:hypothetical protein [Asgard group archaeon]
MSKNNRENELDIIEEEKEEEDRLELELHDYEKKTKPPMAIWKIVLIMFSVLIVSAGISVGIAAILNSQFPDSIQDFTEWVSIFLMLFGGMTVIAGGITGFWGGQRNIPLRLVNPQDATVVGKGVIITGYTIEECLDDEIELTVYSTDEKVLFEALIPVDDNGVFAVELEDELGIEEKSRSIIIESWMVSRESTKLKVFLREEKLEKMNVASKGFTFGSLHIFPKIYEDFEDSVKVLFDPKRKEKGVIEKIEIREERSSSAILTRSVEGTEDSDKYVPFSFEKIGEMRTNALYFDQKRKRRHLLAFLFFGMALLFFLFPLIEAFL